MARGWESKSVEMQIENAETRSSRASAPKLSAAEVKLVREKENLTLTRARVQREMDASRNPRYVELLQRELKALDAQLQKLS